MMPSRSLIVLTKLDHSRSENVVLLVLELGGLEHGAVPETMAANEIAAVLSEYLITMTEQIRSLGGKIGSVEATRITAFWEINTPADAGSCAWAALETVSALSAKCFDDRNMLHLHVGMAAGQVIMIPYEDNVQKSVTIFGKVLASAKSLARKSHGDGSKIIVSEQAKRLLGDQFKFEYLDQIAVKGEQAAERVFQLYR